MSRVIAKLTVIFSMYFIGDFRIIIEELRSISMEFHACHARKDYLS